MGSDAKPIVFTLDEWACLAPHVSWAHYQDKCQALTAAEAERDAARAEVANHEDELRRRAKSWDDSLKHHGRSEYERGRRSRDGEVFDLRAEVERLREVEEACRMLYDQQNGLPLHEGDWRASMRAVVALLLGRLDGEEDPR